MTDAILAALILSPAIITFLLKSNAALGFLALCASFVVSTSAVGDLKQLLNQMDLTVTETTLALVVLVLPLLMTLLLVRSPSGKGVKFVLQLAAAVAAGGLLALSVGPLITASTEFDLEASKLWSNLQNVQAGVIGAGALISFVLIWLGGLSHSRKKHK